MSLSLPDLRGVLKTLLTYILTYGHMEHISKNKNNFSPALQRPPLAVALCSIIYEDKIRDKA